MIGPHVLDCTPAAIAWSQRAGIVKAVNTTLPLTMAKDDAIRVFRLTYANEMDTTDPTATVNQIVAALKGYWHRNLYIQIWCGAHPMRDQLAAAVVLLHMNNLKCGTSWFTGDYTAADWDIATQAGVDVYMPQCYWGNQGFTLDHALRYRQFWKAGQAPVDIAECGRDAVEGGKGGYILDGKTPQAFATECDDYDTEISKDYYVLGAHPFTSGPTPGNPPKGWDPFNFDPVSPLLRGGNVPDPTTFNVGQGVKDLMTQNGDTPQSDEHYVEDATGAVFKSETFGSKGLYQWNKQANKTVLLPFK